MELPETTHEVLSLVDRGSILTVYRGSVAHGTYVPPTEPNSIDDVDFLSIAVAPLNYYFGITAWGNSGTKEVFEGNVDLCEYEIRKFISLLLNCNPNIMAALWSHPEHIVSCDTNGELLIANRDIFLSKRVYESFTGYAHGQLSKMQKLAFQGYMGAKRKELVQKFGYDTKNASHCIRLYRMGCELLETGAVNVDRTNIDRDELISIKNGAWSANRVISEAKALSQRAKEAFHTTTLQDEPDRDKAEELLIQIIKRKGA